MPCKPDSWVIIEINHHGETLHKVLAGWSGGYLDGDSWRVNSGITKIELIDGYYHFYGESGSVYQCHKNAENMRMSQAGIYNQLKEKYDDMVKVVNAEDIETLYLK